MPPNAAIAYRAQLINEIKMGTSEGGVPTEKVGTSVGTGAVGTGFG
jgi:hypothetical protein